MENLNGEMYAVLSKLLKMNVKKVLICSLPSLPGKLSNDIDDFNTQLAELHVIGK